MQASARDLLVPFFTPLVWCGHDSNPQPPALKAPKRTLHQLSYRGEDERKKGYMNFVPKPVYRLSVCTHEWTLVGYFKIPNFLFHTCGNNCLFRKGFFKVEYSTPPTLFLTLRSAHLVHFSKGSIAQFSYFSP